MKHKQKYKNDYVKEVKNILIGLSALILIALFYQLGIIKTTAELETWKTRAIEAEKVRDDVEQAVEEIKNTRKKIEEEEARELAVKYTASAYAYEIPVAFVLACVKMETEYNPDCIGPFQEREDFQIYRPSFARFFPASEWDNRQKRYVAGLAHFAECVRIAEKVFDDPKDQLLLSLALHNAGTAFKQPTKAFKVAWKHMQRAQRLRIWEIADGGLSV